MDGTGSPPHRGASTAATVHKLSHQSTELARRTAANTRLQKEYAARLLETINQMKARIERRAQLGKAN